MKSGNFNSQIIRYNSYQGLLLIIFVLLTFSNLYSQVITPPWATPPKWYFGRADDPSIPTGNNGAAGLNFMNAGYAPTSLPQGAKNADANSAQEGSTTMVDTLGNIAFYTLTNMKLYNGSHTQQAIALAGDLSSTQGSVSFPDPADPANQYYLVVAYSELGGDGIWYYRLRVPVGTNTVTLLSSGQLAARTVTNETITVSADDNYGYWVVSHGQANKTYYAWHVTTGGINTTAVTSSGTITSTTNQGSLKLTRCQDRIGYIDHANGVEVYNWDRKNGKLGSSLRSVPGTSAPFSTVGGIWYGAEFSPDGAMFYFTNLGPARLEQLNISTGTITNLSTASSNSSGTSIGTMQLGADGKIYVLNGAGPRGGAAVYLGVINDPNRAGSGGAGVGANYNPTGFTYASGAGNYPYSLNGIANEGWTNPNKPKIFLTNNCPTNSSINVGYEFKDYYRRKIDTTRVDWDFGDSKTGRGSTTTHTYSTNNTFKVKLTITDKQCNYTWKDSVNVNITCFLPVDWVYFNATGNSGEVLLKWATASEKNNDHFIIQRSDDGVNFKDIGKVPGYGNRDELTAYQFIDPLPFDGQVYYRILQYDFDRSVNVSKVVTLSDDKNVLVNVSPNPTSSDFTLNLLGTSDTYISLSDVVGKEILSTFLGDKKYFKFGNDLAKGTYYLKVIDGGKVYTHKLIKE